MRETIYLDNAAGTPLAPEVREAMLPFLEERFGNPSSRHPLGVDAAEAVDAARAAVARATGARPQAVTFTSGGTEANNLAVLGLARARGSGHVLVGPTEHPSVRESADALAEEGFDVETLVLDDAGELDLDHLASHLRPDTVVVAQMLVNNEFGTRYPVERVARIVRANAPRAALHVDAVQGLGKMALSIGELGAHSLSISAHKVHGPKGAGALVLAEGVRLRPLFFGGGQEEGVRSGTENVLGVVGLGVAARLAAESVPTAGEELLRLRTLLEAGLARVRGARLLAPGRERSPAICAVLLPGPPAEVWMHHLEERGVYTSIGSACQAKKRDLSAGLVALGLDQDSARQVLRISFARTTTRAEVEAALDALVDVERALGVTP
jgi:cysteine desulfurase